MASKGTKIPGGDESPIDLSSILSKPVEGNIQQPVFEPEGMSYEAVLDPEPEVIEPEVITQPVNDGYSHQQAENEPQSLSPDDLAIIGVNMLDGLQATIFAMFRRNKVFEEAELEMIGKLDHSSKTVYPEGSKEAIALAKFARHKEAVANLPFTQPEKQRLTDATKIYVRTTDLKVSPFTGLLLAYGEVFSKRAFEVMGADD